MGNPLGKGSSSFFIVKEGEQRIRRIRSVKWTAAIALRPGVSFWARGKRESARSRKTRRTRELFTWRVRASADTRGFARGFSGSIQFRRRCASARAGPRITSLLSGTVAGGSVDRRLTDRSRFGTKLLSIRSSCQIALKRQKNNVIK